MVSADIVRIHDRCQHAHGVRGRPRDAILRHFCTAQHVAAADHHAETDTEPLRGDEVAGEAVDGRLMNAEFFGAA
jgi:hypothetical protein